MRLNLVNLRPSNLGLCRRGNLWDCIIADEQLQMS